MKAIELLARLLMGCVHALRENFNLNFIPESWKFHAKCVSHTPSLASRIQIYEENNWLHRWQGNCKATGAEGNAMRTVQCKTVGCLSLVMLAMLFLILRPEAGVAQSVAYFSAQHTNQPPLPFNPFPELNTVCLSNRIFVVQDQSVDYEALEETRQLTASMFGFDTEEEMDSYDSEESYASYGPDVLWIEILGVTNDLAYLTLHGTKTNKYYQLLSKTAITDARWKLGEVIYNDTGTNQLYFEPVPVAGLTQQFYRGVSGDTMVYLVAVLNAIEPDPATGDPGQEGLFVAHRVDGPDSPLTLVYEISGTAINGVDYTNISDRVTIGPLAFEEYIHIYPKADSLVEFEEPVTLTLILTNGYVIAPDGAVGTIYISDNYGTNEIWSVVATNLVEPAGLDYHPPTQSLIVSVHYFDVEEPGFLRINSSGQVTNWSGINHVGQEKKLAVVKTTTNGFVQGEIFFSTDTEGVIGKISADGSVTNLHWLALTNSIQPTLFRGGFNFDETGLFSNNLVAVTGGSEFDGGEVWRISSSGTATLLAYMTNRTYRHLEGVTTLTNDVQKWGPWAGGLITGAESEHDELLHPSPRIYAVSPSGGVSFVKLGIAPEDFDLIKSNQDLYISAYNDGMILKLSRNWLTNYIGDMLVTQEGLSPFAPAVFIAKWNPTNSAFETRRISAPAFANSGFEHATFAPINLPNLPLP